MTMRRRRPFAVVLLSGCLILACGPGEVPNLDSPGATIVCFGDSLTAGIGAGSGPTYPELLADRLGVEVINAGVPGDTAEAGLARLDAVLAHDPWLVVVGLGGNDLLRRVPTERTEAALRQIVERLLAARVVPVLVEIDGLFFGNLEAVFDRLGSDYGVPVVPDVVDEVLADPALKSDEVHPNAAGYRRLAAAVGDVVEPIVLQRSRR